MSNTSSITSPISWMSQPVASTSPEKNRWEIITVVGATAPLKEVMKFPHRAKHLETSTQPRKTSNLLSSRIKSIFWAARGEVFEDGMDSAFSRELNSIIKEYGDDAIDVVTGLIVYQRVNLEVAGEALRWLGRIEDLESYNFRRWLLEHCLGLSSTRVKDGATLGLASMDDRHAIPYLKKAIQEEQCTELKADMEQVLEQLEN